MKTNDYISEGDSSDLMADVMLDLESLSTNNNATVLSIGAVQCNVKTGKYGKKIHIFVDALPQMINGADVCMKTLTWWTSQKNEAKNKLLHNKTVEPGDACLQFISFIDQVKESILKTDPSFKVENMKLWGNGILADNVWIENFFKRCGVEFPFDYWAHQDVRTLTQIEDYDKVKKLTGDFVGIKHDAIDDCLHQIKMCHIAYKHVKGYFDETNKKTNDGNNTNEPI